MPHNDVIAAVYEACEKLRSDTGIEVSPPAQKLVQTVILAILNDPHQSWRVVDHRELENLSRIYVSALPLLLRQIIVTQRVESVITSFDILHWLPRLIETMCIFPK